MGSGDGIKGVVYPRSIQYYYNRYSKNKSKRSKQDITRLLILTLPGEDSGDRDVLRTVSNLDRGLVKTLTAVVMRVDLQNPSSRVQRFRLE